MQRSGARAPAVSDANLHDLATAGGPFVSVSLTSEVAVPDAARRAQAHGGPSDGLGALLRWSA